MDKIGSFALPLAVFAGASLMATACGTDGTGGEIECPTVDDSSSASGESTGSTMNETSSTGSGMEDPIEPEFTPQEIAAKLHGCTKIRYATLGTVLAERGVDTTTFGGSGNVCKTDDPTDCAANERCYCSDPPCVDVGNETGNNGECVSAPETPGFLYTTGEDSFSVPKMDSRRHEKDGHTTASAMRLFDIFIQAAPQIIANIDNPAMAPACVLGGMSRPMFDAADGSCVEESISCLLGTPATQDHVLLCNLILDKADPLDAADVTRKQHIAVASILAAAHSCE